jgi:hypothetical protein
MWSLPIGVQHPSSDEPVGFVESLEDVSLRQFYAGLFGASDNGLLGPRAWCDVAPIGPSFLRPAEEGRSDEFHAIVEDRQAGPARAVR